MRTTTTSSTTPPRRSCDASSSGQFGAVTHVTVLICLDILRPSGFADPNSPHPALTLAGGVIADFLPDLASLAHLFVGPHRTVQTVWTKRKPSILPFDEFRALVEAERGTADLGFSSSSQPDAFWLRVYGERMQATANLFETRLIFDGPRNVPKPLRSFASGPTSRRAALVPLLRKFKGVGAYEGLWELLDHTYRALADGTALPITASHVIEVNRMVQALKPKEQHR